MRLGKEERWRQSRGKETLEGCKKKMFTTGHRPVICGGGLLWVPVSFENKLGAGAGAATVRAVYIGSNY